MEISTGPGMHSIIWTARLNQSTPTPSMGQQCCYLCYVRHGVQLPSGDDLRSSEVIRAAIAPDYHRGSALFHAFRIAKFWRIRQLPRLPRFSLVLPRH